MTNPLGYQTSYAYNAAGLLTSTTDADGRTITYGYDAIGEKTSETWVGGNYTATDRTKWCQFIYWLTGGGESPG
jgi:YD repeat-containing protein